MSHRATPNTRYATSPCLSHFARRISQAQPDYLQAETTATAVLVLYLQLASAGGMAYIRCIYICRTSGRVSPEPNPISHSQVLSTQAAACPASTHSPRRQSPASHQVVWHQATSSACPYWRLVPPVAHTRHRAYTRHHRLCGSRTTRFRPHNWSPPTLLHHPLRAPQITPRTAGHPPLPHETTTSTPGHEATPSKMAFSPPSFPLHQAHPRHHGGPNPPEATGGASPVTAKRGANPPLALPLRTTPSPQAQVSWTKRNS